MGVKTLILKHNEGGIFFRKMTKSYLGIGICFQNKIFAVYKDLISLMSMQKMKTVSYLAVSYQPFTLGTFNSDSDVNYVSRKHCSDFPTKVILPDVR